MKVKFMGRSTQLHQVDRHVGMRIRQRRLQLDMSQSALAARLDLTFQQVQKYEKGTNRVSASRLVQMAEVLAVSVSFFFEDAPSVTAPRSPKPSGDAAALLSDRIGIRLCTAFAEVQQPELRAAIINMIEQLTPS
jgi:transcriptional regulator with XRE-family HTH domain